MKAYYTPEGLRLSGKAWEVRRSLRALLRAGGGKCTVRAFLQKRTAAASSMRAAAARGVLTGR